MGVQLNSAAQGDGTAKLDEMKAGMALMRQAAAQAQDQIKSQEAEKSQESSGDYQDEERTRDTASLSSEGRWSFSNASIHKNILAWILEMEEVWEEFINWSPDASKPLTEHLKELETMYRQLWSGLVSNTSGEQYTEQSERLLQLLSMHLNRLLDTTMEDTMGMLGQFGRQEDVADIRSSILYHVTGKTLSPKEAEFFWKGMDKNIGKAGDGNTGMEQSKFKSSSQLPGKARAYLDHIADNKKGAIWQQERELKDVIKVGINKGSGVDAAISNSKRRIYSTGDMEKGQRFFGYLAKEESLLSAHRAGRSDREAALGLAAAASAMKAHVYVSNSGMGKGMGIMIRSAVNRLIDYYISRFAAEGNRGGGQTALNQRMVYQIYHYIISQYQTRRMPGEALGRGMVFADKLTGNRQGKAKDDMAWEREGASSSQTAESAYWKGSAGLLAQDWKKYLEYVGLEKQKRLKLEFHEQSPWGMFLTSEKRILPDLPDLKGAVMVAIGMIAVCMIMIYSLFSI